MGSPSSGLCSFRSEVLGEPQPREVTGSALSPTVGVWTAVSQSRYGCASDHSCYFGF